MFGFKSDKDRKIMALNNHIQYLNTELWKAKHPKKFKSLDEVFYSESDGNVKYIVSVAHYSATYGGIWNGFDKCQCGPIERYWCYSLVHPDTKAIMYSAKEENLKLTK